MSNEETQKPTENARPPKMIKFKIAAWGLVVAVLALVLVWGVMSLKCNSILRTQAEVAATDVATAISAFGAKDILARNYQDLASYADHLVGNQHIAFVAVIDAQDKVVVHTNREFVGKEASELSPVRGAIEASVPVMDLTKQSGEVRVGVRLQ